MSDCWGYGDWSGCACWCSGLSICWRYCHWCGTIHCPKRLTTTHVTVHITERNVGTYSLQTAIHQNMLLKQYNVHVCTCITDVQQLRPTDSTLTYPVHYILIFFGVLVFLKFCMFCFVLFDITDLLFIIILSMITHNAFSKVLLTAKFAHNSHAEC